MGSTGENMKVKILLSFAIIYIVWGSTFTAIKVGLDSFPPIMLASLRFLTAGSIFLFFARLKDFKAMRMNDIKNDVFIGVLLNFGNAGVCWSEKYMSSGVAALVVGAIPVIFMLLNWLSFEHKLPHVSALFAVALGLLGIGLISTDGQSTSDWTVVLVLLLSNCSWVAGSLKFKNTPSSFTYYSRASVQLLSGGICLLTTSILLRENFHLVNVQISGILSVLFLAVVGTVIAYTAYSFLLKNVSTEVTSTYALVNPLVALILGMVFLQEPFTAKVAVSASLILFSVVLTLYGESLFKKLLKVDIPI